MSTARISITARIDDLILGTEDFVLVHDQFATNKTIAHRGAWKAANVPQNSMASLVEAQNLGCAGSEIDLYMTADSLILLNHDATYLGVKVETATAQQLRNKPLPNGEPLPFLHDILRQTQTGNTTRLIIENKRSSVSKAHGLACTDRIVEMVQKSGSQGWVEYISFDFDIVRRILFLDPYAKVAYLNGNYTPEFLAKEGITGFDYNLGILRKNPDWIARARELGLTTNVWTVNTPDEMEYFLNQEIDVITTDEPALLLEKTTMR
ncbi:MAG: glycerophosphodiester phosphodiesterase [Bacteroidales bacterium]